MFQLNFIYFSLALAIGTQFLNYLFMKINIYSDISIFKQTLITTSILLPLIFILNYGFNIYYKYYSNKFIVLHLFLIRYYTKKQLK